MSPASPQTLARRMPRWAFRAVVVLLWLGMTCAVLEVAFDVHRGYIERKNPYVTGFGNKTSWPNTPAPPGAWTGSAALTEAAKMPMEGVRSEEAPVSDALADRTRRAVFFAELGEQDRGRFASTYNVAVLVCDRDGRIIAHYSSEPLFPGDAEKTPTGNLRLADALGQARADALQPGLRQAFDSGTAALRPFDANASAGSPTKSVLFYPVKGADGAISNVTLFIDVEKANQPPVPAESLWDLPFLAYKKHVVSPNGRFWINNVGFRDDDVVIPKPKGLFRIVCVGGSTTEEGDTNAMTYPNLLERRLHAVFGANAVEVVNCGLSGMSSMSEWMRAPDYWALQPDFVIYYNGVNDICHRLCPTWIHEAKWWVKTLRHSRFANYYFNRWLLPSETEMAADLDKEVFTNLRALSAYFAKRGVPMAMCSFASPDIRKLSRIERAYYDWSCEQSWGGRYVTFSTYWRSLQTFNAQVRTMCKDTEMMYIPVAERFNDGAFYFGDICHMKNEGIDLKAQTIFESIQDYVRTRLQKQDGGA